MLKMNKRQLKKRNKKIHNNILSFIPYEIESKVFGSGYFIFEFEEAGVCWFYLKNFPKWKFGIWLNNEEGTGYEIFGQGIASIDKFKPSASVISTDDINEFVDDLYILDATLNGEDTKFSGYVGEDNINEAYDREVQKINDYRLDKVNFMILKFNDDNEFIQLRLVDRNSKTCSISPRYSINVHVSPELDNIDESIYESYIYLQDAFDAIGLMNEDVDKFNVDSYIFDYFGDELKGRKFYTWQQKQYKWKDSYDDHLNYQYDFYVREYDVIEAELTMFIHTLTDSAYNDSDEIFYAVHKRYTESKLTYNVGYAKTLSFNQARKNRKQSQKEGK